MIISDEIKDIMEGASAKALATHGPAGLNVVPVSMIRVFPDSLWLFNFFMNKTMENIAANNTVALACWDGLSGIQLKATVEYIDEGNIFDEGIRWVAINNPKRVVCGILILTPISCYDVTANKNRAGVLIKDESSREEVSEKV